MDLSSESNMATMEIAVIPTTPTPMIAQAISLRVSVALGDYALAISYAPSSRSFPNVR